MSLKDLSLKGLYDSDKDDLLNDFYIPVLSQSIMYDRIAGFFSSNSLAIAAKGITKFIENGGKIRLIANIILSEKDQEAIRQAIKEKETQLIKEIESLDDALKMGHIQLLAWMIKNDKLDIKIAIVPKGIEHKKKGILVDKEGNKISFSGSDNETLKGWLENDEEFHVFCSWIEGDKNRHLEPDLQSFEKMWNNETNEVKVFSVSDAFKQNLIKTAPKDDQEFKEISRQVTESLLKYNKERIKNLGQKEVIKFRNYQLKAIDKWTQNGYKGIFEMATGTGKTFTALGGLKKLFEKQKKLFCVISCPYQHLIIQWEKSIKKFGFDCEIIIADSTNLKWRDQFVDELYNLKNKVISGLIVITTHETFGSPDFVKIVLESDLDKLLIADEVHGIGSEQRREGLISSYNYRLGLSATPDRWFDDIGTKGIRDFFGKTVFEFSLKDAINTIDPETSRSYLVKYDYKPIFVELTNEELEEYEEQTTKIAKALSFTKKNEEKEELLNLLYIKRQKIIINAQNKMVAFRHLIPQISKVEYCLVYCSPKQIGETQKILNDNDIIQHKFTNKEGTKPEKRFGYISEREFLLKEFENGKYPVLVAMKCLDEGVDVPPARIAIILASSGNPKEYIQRRGRILRPHLGKDKAIIYDIIVIPPLNRLLSKYLINIEQKILEKELIRYKEFADASNNKLECLNKIYKVQTDINI